MSNTKNLLTLAAQAVEYEWTKYDPDLGLWVAALNRWWGPHNDDGDAWRLLVALNFDLLNDPLSARSNQVEVLSNDPTDSADGQAFAIEVRSPCPSAASRLAVLRCAAKLGQQRAAAA